MKKKIEPIKHKIFGGWSFYPIVFKDKKYVAIITGNLYSGFQITIYDYQEEKSLFKGHRGNKVFSKIYGYFVLFKRSTIMGPDIPLRYNIKSITSSDFENNYPAILKNIFQDYEKKCQKEKRNLEWDGVIE